MVKTSIVLYTISAVLLVILILPYIQLVPMSMVGIEVAGVKVFAGDLSERNAVLIFMTIITAIAGYYLQRRGR